MHYKFILVSIIFAFNYIFTYSQEFEPLLFEDSSILEIELHYNFDELKNDNGKNPTYHSAQFRYKNSWNGMSRIDALIKTRGIFRRNPDNCSQLPLWIKLNSKDIKNTPFEGISKLKLVLPCNEHSQYEQLLLKEYLAYKIYNIVSPYSYRVRLVKVNHFDIISENKKIMYGFFVEPIEGLVIRLNGTVDERKNIHPNACNRKITTQMAFFQYMIGHTDWSIKALHNITLLEQEIAEPPIPIPFDFDFSGFVNAPYALPAEHLAIKSVTERYFNGYCRSLEEYVIAIDDFNKKKNKILTYIDSFKLINDKSRVNAIEYIEEFYEIINNESRIKREFIDGCRTE